MPVTVQPTHISVWFLYLSHSKHAKYASQQMSVSFWLWDGLYKDSCLIQMDIFWGACKRQAWYWSPAERFSLLIPQDCKLTEWMGPYSPPPHQKPLWNHRPFQEFIVERISGCHLVQPLAQDRTDVDQIAYGISLKNKIFEAISPTTCCICSLSCVQMSSPGPVSCS